MLLALLNESEIILSDDIVEDILDKVKLLDHVLCTKSHDWYYHCYGVGQDNLPFQIAD